MVDKIDKTSEYFKALGDPNRLRILKLISANGTLCVGMIAHKLGITQPAVSQHLKVLKNAGILESEKRGFHVHYHIKPKTIAKIKDDYEKIFRCISGKDKCQNCPEEINPEID